ncbi:MAG: hypothetical protein GX567_13310 [Clostridia bacterium]|nr:hypothetical protein [Clostridia bacterium]
MKKDKLNGWLAKPISYAFMVNVIFLLIALFAFHPHFEENDDAILAFLIEGVYGSRETHMVYVNVCLGAVLRLFYTVTAGIRWYSVFQYAALFVSFTSCTYLFVKRMKHGKLMSLLLLLFTFYEAYVSLQYSKTAAIVSAAGYLMIFFFFEEKRKAGCRRIIPVIGSLLIAYAALLRIESFYLATLLFFGVGLYEVYLLFKEGKGTKEKKTFLQMVSTFLILFLFIGMTQLIDSKAYANDPGWSYHKAFNQDRTDLLDYRYDLLDYSSNQEQLKSLDISENDALLYLTWQFGDDTVFSQSLMQNLLSLNGPKQISVKMLKEFVANLYQDIYTLNCYLLGCVMLLILILIGKEKINLPLLLYIGCALAGVLCYYEYSGRWSHRIVFSVWFLVTVILLYYVSFSNRSTLLCVLAVSIFMNAGLCLKDQFDYQKYLREEGNSKQLAEYTTIHQDALFLIDPFTDQNLYQYDVFTPYPEGIFRNRTYFGGWLACSPVYRDVLQAYGYDNPFAALMNGAQDSNIYLIDSCYPDEKLLFLKEHYGVELIPTQIDIIGSCRIYQMTSGKK